MDRQVILGGAFDPPHNGHIALAVSAAKALGAGKTILLPTGDPPHKPGITPARHRLRMAKLAAANEARLAVSDIEVTRGGVTYTVDTARALAGRGQLTFIVGADEAAMLPSWKDAAELFTLCDFAVLPRAGFDAPAICERLAREHGAKAAALDIPMLALSSTDIRALIQARRDVRGLVPPAVEAYIAAEGLYGGGMLALENETLAKLERALKPKRLRHTLGVVVEADRLAKRHGVDAAQARLAALLHDCAKCMTDAELLTICEENDIPIDVCIQKKPNLAHSFAGAVVARRDYGVSDEAVLGAVANHTFGKPGMTELAQIIFVADFIEPNRDAGGDKSYKKILAKARRLAEEDLRGAVAACLAYTIEYEQKLGRPIHPLSLAALVNVRPPTRR